MIGTSLVRMGAMLAQKAGSVVGKTPMAVPVEASALRPEVTILRVAALALSLVATVLRPIRTRKLSVRLYHPHYAIGSSNAYM
jgi:hypothetical protein